MRVLLISHTYFPSHYRGKLRWLATNGKIDLLLIAIPALRLPSGVRLQFEQHDEPFQVELLQPFLFPNHNPLRIYALHQLLALLRKFRPDIVHVEAEPHSLTLGTMVMLKHSFRYRLIAFTWENVFRRGRRPLAWIEPYTLRHVDWMLAGNHVAAEVVRWRGYTGPVSVFPQVGLDPNHFRGDIPADALDHLPAGMRIGFAGRFISDKGLLDLLEAFRLLTDQALLILLGAGELRETIVQRAHASGVADRVFLPGYVDYREMPAYLRALDVLVLPSRTRPYWREQFGHILAEAMLVGIPVVGADSGAIPEVIGEAGLIYPEGDTDALHAHLLYLATYPDERQRFGAAGRQRALERFTDQAIAQATLQVYAQVQGQEL